MKFVTKKFYAFVEMKWEKLYPYETFCSSRDECPRTEEYPGVEALNAIYMQINGMRTDVTCNLQKLQDTIHQQQDLLKQLMVTKSPYKF